MASDLDDLINQSADESFDEHFSGSDGEAATSSEAHFNHPAAAIFAWLLCASLLSYHYLEPLPKPHDLGIRSVEARLSIAVYHLAYRIESYRQRTGHLPDYVFEDWQESDDVQYSLGDQGYVIQGQIGQFELVFKEGDNPQQLIHRISQREESD